MRRFNRLLMLTAMGMLLQSCESQQPSSPPPSSPSSPPTTSTPPTPPSSSPPSSSPPSEQSSPPSPSQSPQQSSTKSRPQPPSSTKQQSGEQQQTAQSQKDKQQAAESLKKAGQQVAQSGQQLPSVPSQGEQQNQDQQPAGGEWDPMMPDSDQTADSQSDVLEETAAAASEQSNAQSSQQDASEPDDMMMEDELASPQSGDISQASDSPPGESPDQQTLETGQPAGNSGSMANEQLAAEILAAQEALAQAGIALETAGITLETATTDAELAEAEASLGRARLAVIIAGQDLLDIKDVFEGTANESIYSDAEEALQSANVAIVIATESIFSSRIEFPELEGSLQSGGIGSGSESELDKELSESIAIFEGKILDARNEVLGSAPAPTSSDNIPGIAILGGQGNLEGTGSFEENNDGPFDLGLPEVIQQGRMPEGAEIATIEGGAPLVPEDIPSPQGDDIVAKQLREAAIAETDPDLKEKLWDEYKKYKAGL